MDRSRTLTWAKLRVGIVITAALGILLLGVTFTGFLKDIFVEQVPIYAEFHDVQGLNTGAPVWFAGIDIGSVKTVQFVTGRGIRVTMAVDPKYLDYISADARATILTLGILGEKYIEISRGTPSGPSLEPGAVIRGEVPADIQEIIKRSQQSIGKITGLFQKLEELVNLIVNAQGTVGKLFNDPELYDRLDTAAADLARMISRLEAGRGTIGRLIENEEIYHDLEAATGDIRKFAETLEGAEGTVSKLIEDPLLYNRFLKAADYLESFSSMLARGDGSLQKLLTDDSLYRNLASSAQTLDQILTAVRNKEGLMGRVIGSEEMAREAQATLEELHALIRDIRENPKKYFDFSVF